MKLRPKIWLSLGAVLLVVLAIDMTLSWKRIEIDQREEQQFDVQAIRALLMATRRVYHQQFIATLDAHRLPGFLRDNNLILSAEFLHSHDAPPRHTLSLATST
jgi:hypothetical protein